MKKTDGLEPLHGITRLNSSSPLYKTPFQGKSTIELRIKYVASPKLMKLSEFPFISEPDGINIIPPFHGIKRNIISALFEGKSLLLQCRKSTICKQHSVHYSVGTNPHFRVISSRDKKIRRRQGITSLASFEKTVSPRIKSIRFLREFVYKLRNFGTCKCATLSGMQMRLIKIPNLGGGGTEAGFNERTRNSLRIFALELYIHMKFRWSGFQLSKIPRGMTGI